MADIDVVPKGGSSSRIWWIAAIIIIALIVWWAMSRNSGPSTTGQLQPPSRGVRVAASGVVRPML